MATFEPYNHDIVVTAFTFLPQVTALKHGYKVFCDVTTVRFFYRENVFLNDQPFYGLTVKNCKNFTERIFTVFTSVNMRKISKILFGIIFSLFSLNLIFAAKNSPELFSFFGLNSFPTFYFVCSDVNSDLNQLLFIIRNGSRLFAVNDDT